MAAITNNEKTTKVLNERINEILSTAQGKTYTTAVATLVMVALMVFFAIVPAYISITDQIALNEAKTKYVNDLLKKQQAINELVDQSDVYANQVKLLNIYVKDKINSEFLVASFSKIAEDHKCRLTNLTFNKNSDKSTIPELSANMRSITFGLALNCHINEMKNLFAQINNFPVPLHITGVSYTNKKDANSVGSSAVFFDRFNLTITGEYYYWSLPITK